MAANLERHPGLTLYIDQYKDSEGCGGIFVVDSAGFDPSIVNSSHHFREFSVGRYYSLQAMFPHFEACRQGHIFVVDCEGLEWEKQLIYYKFHCRLFEELIDAYPSNFKAMQWYNTPLIANLFYSMTAKLRPAHMRKKVQFGLKVDKESSSDYHNLRDIFSENSDTSNLNKFMDLLTERARNVVEFSLD